MEDIFVVFFVESLKATLMIVFAFKTIELLDDRITIIKHRKHSQE